MLKIFNRETLRGTGLKDNPIIDWHWVLMNLHQGWFIYETNRELSKKEIKNLSQATLDQASDGIGEGFEQQEFASYGVSEDRGYGGFSDWSFDDDEEDEDWVVCSFDWEDHLNGYPIKLLTGKKFRSYLIR